MARQLTWRMIESIKPYLVSLVKVCLVLLYLHLFYSFFFFFATEHAVEKTEIGKNGNRVESFFLNEAKRFHKHTNQKVEFLRVLWGGVEKATLTMRGFTKSPYGLRKVYNTLESFQKYTEGVFVILKQVKIS